MLTMTLGFWSLGDWFRFWLGGATKIELKGNSLNLRADNYLAKIADLAMAWEVMVDNVYDAFPIRPEDTIVDIGGHIGSFTVKAASQAINGKVYTFEPFPSTHAVLKKNTENLKNVHAQQTAVSGVCGSQELFFSSSNPAENSLLRKTDNSIEVPLVTLKAAFDMNHIENVDLMKIDCEGAEYDILFNAGDSLSIVQKMVMEVHEPKHFDIPDKYTIDGLVQLLEDNGFKVSFVRENRFQGYIFASR
tara:strand:- start:4299 stop:5039 length:741 start_codon:yes stop_codon:yes gene_type:complete